MVLNLSTGGNCQESGLIGLVYTHDLAGRRSSLTSYFIDPFLIAMRTDYSRQRPLPAGTMIQEYRIERVLGAGNFGIVYLAKHKYLEELFAIKEFLPAELAARTEGTHVRPLSSGTKKAYEWAVKKFLDEARILRALGRPRPHRSIVRVTHFMTENGTAYMVMEYEKGQPLSDILEQRGPLPETELKEILVPLLDGLEKAHAAFVLHRDIKPDNILIRSDQSPVLIDFGAARRQLSTSARSEMAVYSPGYAAPEQIFLEDEQGPWTDIYGLGCTLYQGVTGELPPNALTRQQGKGCTPAATRREDSYHPGFLKAIDAALELRPADRPQSVAEWRELLGVNRMNADDQGTIIQPKPSTAGFGWKYLAISVGILAVLGLIGGTALWLRQAPDGRQEIELRPGGKARPKQAIPAVPSATQDDDSAVVPRPSPPVVNAESLASEARLAFRDFTCAHLNASVDDRGHLSIAGHVANSKHLELLKRRLSTIEQVTALETENVRVEPWPFCEALKILGTYTTNGADYESALRVETNEPSQVYADGDVLMVRVTAAGSFDGYLYVDYLDNSGELVHMLPIPDRPDNAVSAEQTVTLGTDGTQGDNGLYLYRVTKPFGKAMIITVQARQPLFPVLRPEVEAARDYLPALRSALVDTTTEPGATDVISAVQYIRIDPL